jgi:hypothetical protein
MLLRSNKSTILFERMLMVGLVREEDRYEY